MNAKMYFRFSILHLEIMTKKKEENRLCSNKEGWFTVRNLNLMLVLSKPVDPHC